MPQRYRSTRANNSASSFFREVVKILGWAVVVWLAMSAALVMFALNQQAEATALPEASIEQVQLASEMATDPVIGRSLSTWWSNVGEPAGGASTYRAPVEPAKPRPATISAELAASLLQPNGNLNTSVFMPILYYHTTPVDFDAQLTYLENHGYNVISMDTAIAGLAGGALPVRPVVITFDDGFADQMNAFALLQAHKMPATFYIINGSAGSSWCIGAGRRYNDPLQPARGCGDTYLTWDQVRDLDASGLITIGGHTLDHANLPTLSADDQYREIADSKAGIEHEIGHPIYHFAYPYGSFDGGTIAEVQRAGYLSAVSTAVGTQQTSGNRYQLVRIRNAMSLPN